MFICEILAFYTVNVSVLGNIFTCVILLTTTDVHRKGTSDLLAQGLPNRSRLKQAFLKLDREPGGVAHAFNPSTQGAEAGGSL